MGQDGALRPGIRIPGIHRLDLIEEFGRCRIILRIDPVVREILAVQSVLKWLRSNYTLEENPGIGDKAIYYYYMVMAKALQASGEGIIVDAKGQRHNWREELARKLIALQHDEGYWVNTNKAEMQDNKVLVTSFTLMAVQAVLQ